MFRRLSSSGRLGGMAITVCLFIAANTLEGCREEPSRYGGTVVLSTVEEPAGFNPLFYLDSFSPNIGNLIFNSLVKLDEQLTFVPELAESWRVSEDGRTWDFTLREGVRFHDGEELDANDVAFTYRTMLDPASKSPLSPLYSIVDDIETVDSRQVRFHLTEPYSPFP